MSGTTADLLKCHHCQQSLDNKLFVVSHPIFDDLDVLFCNHICMHYFFERNGINLDSVINKREEKK